MLEVIDDFADGRLRPVKIKTRIGPQCVRPRRRDESHDSRDLLESSVGRVGCGNRRAAAESGWQATRRCAWSSRKQPVRTQSKAVGPRKVSEDRQQAVARPREGIDNTQCGPRRRRVSRPRDILADAVAQGNRRPLRGRCGQGREHREHATVPELFRGGRPGSGHRSVVPKRLVLLQLDD